MEKFAVDLDKVLDDFEFNEDCAEQIASISSASNNSSSSVVKCNLEPSTLKNYNYLPIDSRKTNRECDTVVLPLERHKDSQQNAKTICVDEKNMLPENLDYTREEATLDGTESVNHFYMQECSNDSKVTQKQSVLPYNAEPIPLTIHNDISQKLMQKQQNGGSSPKIDNRYDKKLNQFNLKPSVSNVFSSLNEYINAPPGSSDYIHTTLDKQEIQSDTETEAIHCGIEEPQLIQSAAKDIDNSVNITCKQVNDVTNTSREVFIPVHQNVPVSMRIELPLTLDGDTNEDNAKNVHATALKRTKDEIVSSKAVAVTEACSKLSNETEVVNETDSGEHNFEYVHTSTDIVKQDSSSTFKGDGYEEESAIQSDESTKKLCTSSSESVDISEKNSHSTGKPFGFGNIDDLSENELTKYLAELEEEEEFNEKKNQQCDNQIAEDKYSDILDNANSKDMEEEEKIEHEDDHVTSENEYMSDAKAVEDVQEHCTYKLNMDRELLNNDEIEEQLGEQTEDAEQYNQVSNLQQEGKSNTYSNSEEQNLPVSGLEVSDDTAYRCDNTVSNSADIFPRTNTSNATDESEKPVRPQTLDIVLSNNTNGHQTLGSMSEIPAGQRQSNIEGPAEDQESSPDILDTSLPESNSILGKQPPFWVPDSDAPSCMFCDVKFTVLKRRHHCRACGKVLCNKCCNMKYKLEYQGNIDSRVCVSCHQLLTKAEAEQSLGEWSPGYSTCMTNNDINSPQGRQPNPNNPMEYCSTIPPLQQLAGGLPPPPSVMVPVGVLKREGGTKNRPEVSKSVMFSDGIRPGCDLTELDMSGDTKPLYRKPGSKRAPTPGSSMPSTSIKRQNLPRLDPNTESYVPQDPHILPPTVTIHKGQVSYHVVMDEGLLYKTLKNECEPPVLFAINRNLYAFVKILNLNCCINKICWNVVSKGLACVGQDEVILLIETLPDETRIPIDLFVFINQLYLEAIKGNTVSELGFSLYQGGNLLGSREHAGFLFIRQTLQCLQKIVLPPAPFLVGLLVHRWETPWAKVFPLRLVLRLGAEYRYYPCPLFSVRFRDALYFEIGHTVMKVLADFRNYGYTLPSVRSLTIHLRNRMTDVMFPKNRYDQVIKGLNNSNDHVLAYASNFSITADSHLVCIQTNTGDESSYQTQAISINNKPRTVTGTSFIVINGALKSSMGLSAKSSIVEDGLMVEIMPEKMEALKAALKNMQDFSIGCGRQGAPEPDETVNIKWVENDVQFNLGVKSPIDGQLMDGIPSIRVHNGTDYKGTSRFIRWTEVFIIKSDDHPNGLHDPLDINKLSGNIAKATSMALVKLLDLLATAGFTKLGVRATIHPDNVGYEAGSEGMKLPPIYMNSLDNELIQVLHRAVQSSQDTHTVLELIFYILDD
ncbi:Zinc finger FYVE domain-containing protein 9 [Dufourea novaeangliae]|uniref:Zinc finger FYVE domain-containing protein 9 n=1 Tax=Dufourea novaeangliae TaxID=178035 RepID=A0A154PSE4_DUFNO|nr:Zinc finger FYVE domain-containing protein 9 [Dufourea novaeangliae]